MFTVLEIVHSHQFLMNSKAFSAQDLVVIGCILIQPGVEASWESWTTLEHKTLPQVTEVCRNGFHL